MASISLFSLSTIPHPIGLIICQDACDTLIFAQISRKISSLAGSWLVMPLTQSLTTECPLILTRRPRFSDACHVSVSRTRSTLILCTSCSYVCCADLRLSAASALALELVWTQWRSDAERLTIF